MRVQIYIKFMLFFFPLFALNWMTANVFITGNVMLFLFPLHFIFPSFSIPSELVKLSALSQHYSLWRYLEEQKEDEKSIGSKCLTLYVSSSLMPFMTLLQYIRRWKLVSFFRFSLVTCSWLMKREVEGKKLCVHTCCNALHEVKFVNDVNVDGNPCIDVELWTRALLNRQSRKRF